MFWTIVAALAFFFIGIPLIIRVLASPIFWAGAGMVVLGILLLTVVTSAWTAISPVPTSTPIRTVSASTPVVKPTRVVTQPIKSAIYCADLDDVKAEIDTTSVSSRISITGLVRNTLGKPLRVRYVEAILETDDGIKLGSKIVGGDGFGIIRSGGAGIFNLSILIGATTQEHAYLMSRKAHVTVTADTAEEDTKCLIRTKDIKIR